VECTDWLYSLTPQVLAGKTGNWMSPVIAGVKLAAQQSIESLQSSQSEWSVWDAMSWSTMCPISICRDIILHVAGLKYGRAKAVSMNAASSWIGNRLRVIIRSLLWLSIAPGRE